MAIEDVLRREHNDAIRALVRAMDLHQPGEGDHAERVAVYATATAEKMGMADEELVHVRQAATLHDVGKIAIDPSLLHKLGKLSEEDLNSLRLHAMLAMSVIESLEWLAPAVPMIVHHHERWDGDGYPEGLTGEEIPLGARIIAVAEAFDVLTAEVGWRYAMTEKEALEEILRCAGSQFDPAVVDAFALVQPLIQPLV